VSNHFYPLGAMMKKLILIVPLLLFGMNKVCTKCTLNKAQMRCDYYAAIKAEAVKDCEEYAAYLDKTEVYGKAAWYYLLAKRPKKALEAAQKAVKRGEKFAYEYMAEAQMILGKNPQKSLKKLKESVKNYHFFLDKDLKILHRLYKKRW